MRDFYIFLQSITIQMSTKTYQNVGVGLDLPRNETILIIQIEKGRKKHIEITTSI